MKIKFNKMIASSVKLLNEFIKNEEGTDIIKLSSQYFSTGHNFVCPSIKKTNQQKSTINDSLVNL